MLVVTHQLVNSVQVGFFSACQVYCEVRSFLTIVLCVQMCVHIYIYICVYVPASAQHVGSSGDDCINKLKI